MYSHENYPNHKQKLTRPFLKHNNINQFKLKSNFLYDFLGTGVLKLTLTLTRFGFLVSILCIG